MSLDPQRVDRQQERYSSDPASARFTRSSIHQAETARSGDSGKANLHQDEQELGQIVDLIPQAIIVLNSDGKAVYANRVALEYTGLSLDEVQADNFRDRVFHPQDIQRLREERQSGLAGTIPFENEQRALGKDGRYRWFLIQYSPLLDENEEVIRWYATGTDIEERQRAQAALAKAHDELESEGDRLRLLVEVQKALVTNLDLRSLMAELTTSLRRVTDCDFVGLALPDSSSGELRLHFACYLEGRGTVKEGMTVPLRGSASGKAFRTRQLVCLNNVDGAQPDPQIYDTREGREFYQFVSLNEGAPSGYFLPLVRGNEVIAVLQLTKHGKKPLKAQEAEFLSALAGQFSVAVANALEHAALKAVRERLASEQVYLREEVVRSSMFEEIVGSSKALREIQSQISQVAPTNSMVLIQGETGTGKELIARAIHNRSKRANRAFICVNCAAISPSLIASELFGHEKGAFTGAFQKRLGRFESADGGTIFLDEVGELPLEMQTTLLRVLQEREFERIGGNQSIHVDVRVLAATNRDLDSALSDGSFRQDLFYRLNVFPIQVPPLRERVDDIALLVEYLVDRYAKKAGKPIRSISKRTLQLFQNYSWPGNVRELQNVIERAVIVCDGETFQIDASWLKPAASVAKASVAFTADIAEREKAMIENALRDSKGLISGPGGAAAKLGLPRQTLESKIRKLRINRYRYKTL
jgi:formate hydrogenlyase transcriptional activator